MNIPNLRQFDMERTLCWVVSACAFLFPLTVLSVNRADSAILLLLGAIGLYVFLRFGVRTLALSRRELLLMGIFLGWYAVIVLCYFAGDTTYIGFKMLGRNLRLLFFVPAFLACRRYLVNGELIFKGLVLAPFGIVALGLWQFMHADGHIRASGFVDAIPFGDLSMAMAFMAPAILLMTQKRRTAWCYLLVGTALSAGIGASILSGSRGGWIALPLMLTVTVTVLSNRSRKRALKVFLLSAAFVLLAWRVAPQEIIKNRIDNALSDINNYYNYVQLIERNDVRRIGCLNDQLFLKLLTQKLQIKYGNYLKFNVMQDENNIKKSGFLSLCQSGSVIRVANSNKLENKFFAIPRSVIRTVGAQNVEFFIKGKGLVSVVHSKNSTWRQFDNPDYKLVTKIQDTSSLAWPVFSIQKGGEFYFVPVQKKMGEYVFPFANDSVGQRLEMWRAAWHIFKQHILMGAGTGSFLDEVGKRVRAGDVSPAIISYDHPHNDYMNVLSSQGTFGFLAFLLALGYPLSLFVSSLRSKNKEVKAAGFSGVIMISGLLIFGLTETMFTHSIVMSWYVTFTAMFAAIIFRPDDGKHDVEP
ncbi:MAG TPA: O-antigen ligase family protein [Gammaproteobacteria bacterium]|nr:O-antigen ligase family protein [Gammaproteobacteria bacterium]